MIRNVRRNIQMITNTLSETAESRWKCNYIFKVSKGKKKNKLFRILYSEKVFFKTEGELMTFSDRENLTFFVVTDCVTRNVKGSFSSPKEMI